MVGPVWDLFRTAPAHCPYRSYCNPAPPTSPPVRPVFSASSPISPPLFLSRPPSQIYQPTNLPTYQSLPSQPVALWHTDLPVYLFTCLPSFIFLLPSFLSLHPLLPSLYARGVIPTSRWNVRVKCALSENPTASATCMIESLPSSSSPRAWRIR